MSEELQEFRQADAARFLKRTPQRVLQWRQRGDLVGYYHGKVWLIGREELEAFAAQPKRGPGRPKRGTSPRREYVPLKEPEGEIKVLNEYLKEEYA